MSDLQERLREAARTTPDREIAAPHLLDAAEAIKRWSERYTKTAAELDRLQKAVTAAMEKLSNGDTEGGARILRECFWGTDAKTS